MKNFFEKMAKKPVKSIIISKILIDLLCVLLYHNIFPYLLNYPPNSINTPFQLTVNPTYYSVYYFSIFSIGILLDAISAYIMLRPIKKYSQKKDIDEILKVRKTCYSFSNKSFSFTTLILPLIVGIGALLLTKTETTLSVKIGMLAMVFLGIPNLIMYFLANRILKNVLINTFDIEVAEKEEVKKTKLWRNLSAQIVSTLMITFVLLFMVVLANIMNIVGNYRFETYQERLNALVSEIYEKDLKKEEIDHFIQSRTSNEKWFIHDKDGYRGNDEISDFMQKYISFYAKENGGRAYDNYGIDKQAALKYIVIDGEEIIIGFTYTTIPSDTFSILLTISIMFVLVDFFVIYIASKNIETDLKEINNRLADIAKNNQIELSLLPITSRDEMGELTREFNNVQKNTINLYDEIQKNQEIIMIQNKFASVGELAAGMAHDINNPASSLDASIDLLTHFKVEEEKQQIYNELVNNMKLSNNKILSVVNNTQNQFRNISKTDKTLFSLNDMLNNLAVSEENDIAKVNGKINVYINETIQLYGIESRLYQVIMNLIRNSVLSYREKSLQGNVDINAKMDDNMCVISVTDTAGGIPEEVRDTIFKKILTTRGTKGTGLGLYLAAGIIEGDFKGTISFDTETGRGTTFYIRIPMDKGDNE